MGFALSWFACRKSVPKAILDELRARLKQDRQRSMSAFSPAFRALAGKLRPIFESEIVSENIFSNDWHMVMIERGDVISTCGDILKRLSLGTEVVACYVEEHVMYSAAADWKNGEKTWSVVHDSQQARNHIQAVGKMPPKYLSIYQDLTMKQKRGDADYLFDVPVEVAKSITGFRHDQDFE